MYLNFIKPSIDKLIAIIGLIFTFPIFISIAIINTINFRGNPFFTQARPGKNEKKIFIDKADNMLFLNGNLQEQSQKFLNLLKSDFNIEKPSKKIEEFYTLTWSEFEKELSKNKITLLGIQKDDWLDRFERLKKQALDIKNQIDQTDKEIDRMVYELYGLTDEEIQIVENS